LSVLALGWSLGHAGAQAAAPACPPSPQSLLTPAAMEQARQDPRDRGFLWRLEKDGRTSWLYGTLHVGRAAWLVPGPQVAQALRSSDTVALELDILDARSMQPLTSSGDPKQNAEVLTPGRARQLAALWAQACVEGEQSGLLRAMSPVLQASTLSGLVGRGDGLYADFGSELVLAAYARKAGLPVIALETAEQQYAALVPDTAEAQAEVLDQFLTQLRSGAVRQQMLALARLWADSDLAKLLSYEKWCDCLETAEEKAQWKKLLDERNPHMADGIAAAHGRGGHVFAAVGALHMAGTAGLPQLLAQRGFTVTQVLPAAR